jgi:predicted nucleotidyltransferase
VARGKLRAYSDVDMAVLGLPPEVFLRAMAKASRALGRPLDLIDLDEDNIFTHYLKEEGELRRVG